MSKFYSSIIVSAAVIASMLGTPVKSMAQAPANNEPADYPLGNRIFDRWLDNRRATHGRIVPQMIVSPYSTNYPYSMYSPYSQVVPTTMVQPSTTPEVIYYDTASYPISRGRFFLFRRR
jgi:hypothetical protein